MEKIVRKIEGIIRNNQKFLITSHINPDGDSIGSSLALNQALKKLNKEAIPLLSEKVPQRYKFLPGVKEIRNYNKKIPSNYVFIVLECSNLERLKKSFKKIIKTAKIVINIDHHSDNDKFGQINWIDKNASSVGEMVYKVIKELKIPLDKDIATCLYTAIITDTGNFKYSNTNENTLKTASQLLKTGIKANEIVEKIYENMPLLKIKLLAYALNNFHLKNKKIAYVSLPEKKLKELKVNELETEEIIGPIRTIEGIKIVVLFRQTKKGEVKISFRSKDKEINVHKIAQKFGGGGHPSASACTIKGELEEVQEKVLKEINIHFNYVRSSSKIFS